MKLRALALVLSAAVVTAPAAAQRVVPAPSARLETAFAVAAPAPAPLTATGSAVTGQRASSGSRAALHLLGGALIGAGAGFLTSQVAWSDWDKTSNSEFKSRRLGFTLGGSALGAITGLVLGRHSAVAGSYTGPAPTAQVNPNTLITEEEVRASTAQNLYQLIQELRPSWLRRGGVTGHTVPNPDPEAQPTAQSAADDTGLKVYVERGYVGDVWSLREIPVTQVSSLEFLDTAAATYRLGQGNPSGAIVVHTGRRR
jgi:hypothetical protein